MNLIKIIWILINGKTCSGSPELARAKAFNKVVIETMKALLALFSGRNLGNYSDDSTFGRSTDLFGSLLLQIQLFSQIK